MRPNRKDDESEYYGKSRENLESYKKEFKKWNPDKGDPMSTDSDERVVVSIGPRSHGRSAVLDSVITPSISYRRIRATNPRPSPRPRPEVSPTATPRPELAPMSKLTTIWPRLLTPMAFVRALVTSHVTCSSKCFNMRGPI